MLKKVVSVILTFSILFNSAAPVSRAAEVSGKCGADCDYVLSADGVLSISGTGSITKKFNEDEQINKLIKKIVIHEGVTKIDQETFKGMNYQKIEVELPDTLTEIGEGAFENSSLERIVLPESLKKLGIYAFAGINNIKKVHFPQCLTKISAVSFANCTSLKSIEWPEMLTQIDERAFEYCNFSTVKIPDTVKTIKADAFNGCARLKIVTIGKSVKKVSPRFAVNCYALKKIVNNSNVSIALDTLKGKRNWYVGKKKVTKLKPGKTAKAVYKKYKIKYKLNGGKIVGKKPKSYVYRQKARLPKKARKKGYTFIGWYVSGKNDWQCFPEYIDSKMYGTLTVSALFKKYKVESVNGKIKVTVKDAAYGKKNYSKSADAYFFRYSENKDMSDSSVVVYTAPYGKGVSKKLKKGKTYYVEISRYFEPYMEDSEDFEEPFCGWHCKRSVTIK